jgi:hypothetical protein
MKKLAVVPLAAFPLFADAAAVNVTAVVADVAAQAASITLIGAAVLLIVVGIKAFKWVRRAM